MRNKRWIWIAAAVVAVAVGIVVAFGVGGAAPARILTRYPLNVLAEEAKTMDDCAECHEPDAFHTCTTCHDDHGAIELADVPFYAGLTLEGDVPGPGYILLNEILPYHDQPNTHLPLLDFLTAQGVTDFESVTLASLDGGFVTIHHADLTPTGLLMPYEDGIRFADESLHVSAWIKGIRRVIVVGPGTPLQIEGQPTSMGRLLLGPTQSLTVEQTDVMFRSEDDGQVRKAQSGSRIEGVPITTLVTNSAFAELTVRDAAGETHALTAEEAQDATLAQFRGRVTLILPARGRAQWLTDVVAVETR